MLWLSGVEPYSRWVPLKYTTDHPHFQVNIPSINLISKSIFIKSIAHCPHLPNLVSAQVVYDELAGGLKPIRNGEIF